MEERSNLRYTFLGVSFFAEYGLRRWMRQGLKLTYLDLQVCRRWLVRYVGEKILLELSVLWLCVRCEGGGGVLAGLLQRRASEEL